MDRVNNYIKKVCNDNYEYLMNLENVEGVGRGYKFINKTNTLEPCIHVLVEKKIESSYLSKNNIIPNRYMGLKTDVIEVGSFIVSSGGDAFPNKIRPLSSGCVIGLMGKESSGTLGCIVSKEVPVEGLDDSDDKDNETNEISYATEYFILSNNHVLANRNDAPIGSLIIQPSKPNNGKLPTDLVGVLNTFIPIKYIDGDNKPINYVDCAIAKVINKKFISNDILSLGKIKGLDSASLNMKVRKVGHVSGLTEGVVMTLNATNNIKFINNKSAVFKEQIISTTKTLSGDSGSLVLTNENKIVAMVMGTNSSDFAICNDINIVLKELNVKIYTG